MITVESVGVDDPRCLALWQEFDAELERLYGEPDIQAPIGSDGIVASLLALGDDGEPVGTVLARWSRHHPDNPGTVEIRRLYVRPQHRGHGHARVMMGVIERAAFRVGATRLVLGTGEAQPQAIALYEGIGYSRIPPFGIYANYAKALCLAKSLPTRLLVINGTMGAGKTSTAAAICDLLGNAGARVAFIDADALCQARPEPSNDPYQQHLLMLTLSSIAPIYRSRGYGCIVIARVVEDAEDRERYSRAFGGRGGPAQVSVVRVTASDETRVARLTTREPEGRWQEFGVARSRELHEILEDLDLDDGVVATDETSREEAARQVLDVAGWWLPGEQHLAQ